jgi:hypothetical protein
MGPRSYNHNMSSREEAKNAFSLLVICSALTLVLWFVPLGWVLTYPFRMFVTLIHEGGHAAAALISLGSVHRIYLDWHGNGMTETSGGIGLLISSAGYLGATIYGAVLLLLLRRADRARPLAIATAALLLLETVVLGSNIVMWVAGLGVGLMLLLVGWMAPRRVIHFFMSFLAIQALLNALYDLRALLYLSVFDSNRLTDARNMAVATGNLLPAAFWAIAWGALAVGILAFTLVIYYKSLVGQKASTQLAVNYDGLLTADALEASHSTHK